MEHKQKTLLLGEEHPCTTLLIVMNGYVLFVNRYLKSDKYLLCLNTFIVCLVFCYLCPNNMMARVMLHHFMIGPESLFTVATKNQ